MSNPLTKEQILNLVLNHLTSIESRENFWQEMISGLHINDPVYQSEELTSSDVLQNIFRNIDWEMLSNNEYGEDKFFNGKNHGLYTSLKEELKTILEASNDYKRMDLIDTEGEKNWWTNNYWNESVAKLLQILAQRIDPQNVINYEKSGLLIELIKPEGKIDTEHLRGGISAHGAKAELRIIDIMDADAGNSFEGENDTYWYGDFYSSISFSYIVGNTEHISTLTNVLFMEEADTVLSKIRNEEEITSAEYKNLLLIHNEGNNGLIYSGTIEADISNLPNERVFVKMTVSDAAEHYRFKVVKNPWVIPWYNFDAETYSYVRGDDKRVSALTDSNKLDFTREQSEQLCRWIRLLMPRYKRKVEVEDLNRNFWVIGQVLAGISADLFDEDGPIQSMIKGLLKEIGELWENMVYLWAALALLSQNKFYSQTHNEIVFIQYDSLRPYLKYDNITDIQTQGYVDAINSRLNYLLQKYPEKNLCILPVIRLNNYEKNYYAQVWYPGIWFYDRNVDNDWEYVLFPGSNGIVINLEDYNEYIYGLYEQEEVYSYVTPLKYSKDIISDNELRYYGLARDEIVLNCNLYEREGERWERKVDLNCNINLYDLARKLVTSGEKNHYIYKLTYSYDGTTPTSTIYNILIDEHESPLDNHDPQTAVITKGYYQGELLSTSNDVSKIIYDIYVLPSATLKPTTMTLEEILAQYNTSSCAQMRAEDEKVLNKIIDNFVDYNSLPAEFWTQERLGRFSAPPLFFGNNGQDVNYTRQDAIYSFYNSSEKAYPTQEDWQTQNQKYFKMNGDKNLESTILFVEGRRGTDYLSNLTSDAKPEQYFPYDGNNTDGLTMSFNKNANVRSSSTGAVISLPIKGQRASGFYPMHKSVNLPTSTVHTTCSAAHRDVDAKSYIKNDDTRVPYAAAATHDVDSFKRWTEISGAGGEQWLVGIKNGETAFTPDNWLVVKIEENWLNHVKLYDENLGGYTGFEKFCFSGGTYLEEDVHAQLARRIAQEEYETSADHSVGHIAEAIKTRFAAAGIDNYDLTTWYYAQAIMHGSYDAWYKDQCHMYNVDQSSYLAKAEAALASFGKTAPYIGQSSHGIKDPEGNTFSNRLFIAGSIVTEIRVYVFGPNQLYSRRGYYRDANGHWTSQTVINEETKNGNVDEIRANYTIVSNNRKTENFEKYKSKFKMRLLDAGYYNPSLDDNLFNSYSINWQDIGQDYPWDIPS